MSKFECGFCGKQFDNVEDRMKCETTCQKSKAEQEKREKEKKLAAEKQSRVEEIQNILDCYKDLVDTYCKDFKCGLTIYNGKIITQDDLILNKRSIINEIIQRSLTW